jgi:hypothetical protein
VALKANIVIDQGTDFSTSINVTDDDGNVVDLTGYSAAAQMRKHYTSSSYYAFTTAVNSAQGIVTISMTAGATANITAGRYVYDCELTSNTSVITRLVEGIVTVTPQVTR